MSALGLLNTSTFPGVYPLSTTRPDARRKFRSSYLVSFRGTVALERLSCDTRDPSSTIKHTAGQLVLGPGMSESASKYVRIRVSALNLLIVKHLSADEAAIRSMGRLTTQSYLCRGAQQALGLHARSRRSSSTSRSRLRLLETSWSSVGCKTSRTRRASWISSPISLR